MAGNPGKLRRRILIVSAVVLGLFGIVAVMSWPSMLVSECHELTGTDIDLLELARFYPASREGSAGTVYRIPDPSADRLNANQQSLRKYPMWSALAFDGYKRVRWQTLQELKSGPDRLLAETLFGFDSVPMDASSVRSMNELRDLATALAVQESTLIGGWYTDRDGAITNYFVYVLDLRRRLLVKVSLLT